MYSKLISISLSATFLGSFAIAEVPRVAADITPVHSLVSRVMDGVETPDLIVPPGESPHGFSMRPSSAEALQSADVVFWVGHALTPQLEDAIETLASDAAVVELIEADGVKLLAFRDGALFEAHGHDGDGHDDHDHDHEQASEEAHEDHDGAHEEHAEHAHDGNDPHAWLSTENARVWLDVIAAELSAADPAHADAYVANAAAAKGEIEALSAEVNAALEPVRGKRFIVFHDAYHYFESDFGFPAAGAISISDASDPSPARIAEIQSLIRDEGVDCVLSEPQFNAGLVTAVLEGTEAKTAVIDPLGGSIEPGSTLYPNLIRNLANSLAECLTEE